MRGSVAPGKRPSEEDKSSADTAAELFALYGRSTDSEKSRTDSDEAPIIHKPKVRRRAAVSGESMD